MPQKKTHTYAGYNESELTYGGFIIIDGRRTRWGVGIKEAHLYYGPASRQVVHSCEYHSPYLTSFTITQPCLLWYWTLIQPRSLERLCQTHPKMKSAKTKSSFRRVQGYHLVTAMSSSKTKNMWYIRNNWRSNFLSKSNLTSWTDRRKNAMIFHVYPDHALIFDWKRNSPVGIDAG